MLNTYLLSMFVSHFVSFFLFGFSFCNNFADISISISSVSRLLFMYKNETKGRLTNKKKRRTKSKHHLPRYLAKEQAQRCLLCLGCSASVLFSQNHRPMCMGLCLNIQEQKKTRWMRDWKQLFRRLSAFARLCVFALYSGPDSDAPRQHIFGIDRTK